MKIVSLVLTLCLALLTAPPTMAQQAQPEYAEASSGYTSASSFDERFLFNSGAFAGFSWRVPSFDDVTGNSPTSPTASNLYFGLVTPSSKLNYTDPFECRDCGGMGFQPQIEGILAYSDGTSSLYATARFQWSTPTENHALLTPDLDQSSANLVVSLGYAHALDANSAIWLELSHASARAVCQYSCLNASSNINKIDDTRLVVGFSLTGFFDSLWRKMTTPPNGYTGGAS